MVMKLDSESNFIHDRPSSCKRFEELLIASLDRDLNDSEVDEFLVHQQSCPSGVHNIPQELDKDIVGSLTQELAPAAAQSPHRDGLGLTSALEDLSYTEEAPIVVARKFADAYVELAQAFDSNSADGLNTSAYIKTRGRRS